ncbi:MAG: hypothetical protein JXR07_07600 [Reichenbachiella sp.]
MSCSEKDGDMPNEIWKIQALEIEVNVLNEQNAELTKVLIKMHSTHFSVRALTEKLISNLENVKTKIRNMAEGIIKKEPNATYSRTSKNVYPPTMTFRNKKVPVALSKLVNHCIESYDNHPRTDGQMKNEIISLLSQKVNENTWNSNKLFDDLSLAESIEILEMMQIRILIHENKYLMAQFDQAINRVIIMNCR